MANNDNRRLNSRLNKPKRKKKNNTILNVLIGFVLLLIIIVVVNIVVDKEPETSKVDDDTTTSEETNTNTSTNDDEEEDSADSEKDSSEENTGATIQTSSQEENNESASSETDQANIVLEPSEDPVAGEVVVDPSWAPIGTSQTGEHASSYDSESVDYKEKVQALSYGSGLDSSNMFVKFLGNGGSPQKSIGTVTSKDGKEIYRIHLEWIDGEGWKPTKKEKLTSLEDAS